MKHWHHHLLRLALAGTTIGFAWASYAREGMSPLDVLPTLVTAEPWHYAWAPLAIVTLSCVAFAVGLASRSRLLRSNRLTAGQIAATCAALATYSYDFCHDNGLSWLPEFQGCHCWVTGAAALCTAVLSTTLLYCIGACSIKLVQLIYERSLPYVRRRLYRPFAGQRRIVATHHQLIVRVRLLAFRGPPIRDNTSMHTLAQPFEHRSLGLKAVFLRS